MPGAGPMMRRDFPKLYAERLPYIREMIGPDEWPEVDNMWEQFFSVENSDRMREEMLQYAGFGYFREMGENDAVTYDALVQGPSKVINHVLYGLGYQIGYLAAKHDLDGIINKNAPELGRSLRMSVQTLAASFWNGSFDTQTTPDGQYYFSTAHTFVRGGGTWSNRSSTDATLGHTALETALVNFMKQKDLMGNPMPLSAKSLMIPPDLEPIAYELTQSRMRHDTTTHAESYVYNKVRPIVWPFLTITTMWVVLGPKEHRKVKWYWNIRPETSHGFDFDREAAKTKTLFACSFGAWDGRGTYGSRGY